MKNQHSGRQSWGRKGLSIFLTMGLLVSLLTTAAFAEGETGTQDTTSTTDVEEVLPVEAEENQDSENPEDQDTPEEEPQDAENENADEAELPGESTVAVISEEDDDEEIPEENAVAAILEEDDDTENGIQLTSLDEPCDHNWTTYPCSSGWVYQVCSKCGVLSEDQVYTEPTIAHTWDGWKWSDEERVACASGEQYAECAVCGELLDWRYADSDVAHTWDGNWVVEVDATSCTSGSRYQRCLLCGAYDYETIPHTGSGEHNWGAWVEEIAPTACSYGYRTRVCKVCDEFQADFTAPTGNSGHKWGEWVVDEQPTCQNGYHHRVCQECGYELYEDIPATQAHTWGEWTVTVPATCASGIKTRTCTVCTTSMEKLIPPVSDHEHIWSNWIVSEELGCAGSILTRTCIVAGDSWELREYNWRWIEGEDYIAPATEEKTLAGTGDHVWGTWEPVVQASCVDGEERRDCLKCTAYETRTIPAVTQQHNWVSWITEPADECHESYQYRYCLNENCGAEEKDKTDQEIYHHTSALIRVASCISSDSYQPYTFCILCGHYYACDKDGNQLFDESGATYWPDSISAYNPNNHDGGTNLINAVAATDTTNGYTGDLYCLGCDELIEAGVVIYPVLSGAGATWTFGSKNGLSIRSNADFSKFVKVLVNGVELDSKYYTVTKGSTIVTLSQEYLETLEDGEYTIEIVSTDGSAITTFNVAGNSAKKNVAKSDTKSDTKTDTKSDSTVTNPKTGDESSLALWISALGFSFVALALLTVLNKKSYTEKRSK